MTEYADLSGDSPGLIRIPGDKVYTEQYAPGYDNAAFVIGTDCKEGGTKDMKPSGAFYNLAMFPGTQKWKPTHRYGQITAIDGDTCSVTLETANSYGTGLNINQTDTLSTVPISYMT
jgi:hypothetical protein